MNDQITSTLERTLLNFASYAAFIDREGYADVLRKTLMLPHDEKVAQLEILKHTISEIFNISPDQSEFRDFVHKYDLSADEIRELLIFLGPDSGLRYFAKEESVYITLPSYLKNKLSERIADKVFLYVKLKFGRDYWEEIEYVEANESSINDLLKKIYTKSPELANYVYNSIK